MGKSLPVTANASLFLPVRNTILKAIALCAAAATSVLEVFDGTFGTIATAAIGVAGTGYTAGDLVTLVSASGGVQATFLVATETLGVPDTLTLVSGGTGYVAGSTYATTGGTGTGLTITASTVTDAGSLVAKLSTVANESAPPVHGCFLTTNGVSVRISGSAAKGHIVYE